MSEINQSIAKLEQNIVLLLNKLKDNHYAIETLRNQLEEGKSNQLILREENDALKHTNESLKLANALLGSEESNTTTTKNKISALIHQVDTCIAQLKTIE